MNKLKDKINYVLHQASLTSVVESHKYPEKYIYENFSSYKNIVEFCIKKKVKSLVFASSSAVYGNSIKKNFEKKVLKLMLLKTLTYLHMRYQKK